jgi:hypothetical protein
MHGGLDSPRQQIFAGENEASEHIKEKHLEMVMNARQAGRDVEAVPVYADVVGDDLARTSVEASQKTMRKANRKSFMISAPWKRDKSG